MLRKLQPFEQEVKKIELRRDYEEKRHRLEAELLIARTDQARQVGSKQKSLHNLFSSFRNYSNFNINSIFYRNRKIISTIKSLKTTYDQLDFSIESDIFFVRMNSSN